MKLLNPKWETVRDDVALLVIDVQTSFIGRPDLRQPHVSKFIEKVNHTIKLAGKLGVPVYILEYEKCGPTIPEVQDTVINNGVPVHYVKKNRDDGSWHFRTELSNHLRPEPKKILVAGLNTEFCVCRTVYGLRAFWDYAPEGRGRDAECLVLEPACVSTMHNQDVAWKHFDEYHKTCENVRRFTSINKAFREALKK